MRFKQTISRNPNIQYTAIKGRLHEWCKYTLLRNPVLTLTESAELANLIWPKKHYRPGEFTNIDNDIRDDFNYEIKNVLPVETEDNIIIQWPNVFLTWKVVMDRSNFLDNGDIKYICNYCYRKSLYYTMYLSWKYLHLWRANVAAKISRQIRENYAIYDCCVHELKMRFRDMSQSPQGRGRPHASSEKHSQGRHELPSASGAKHRDMSQKSV